MLTNDEITFACENLVDSYPRDLIRDEKHYRISFGEVIHALKLVCGGRMFGDAHCSESQAALSERMDYGILMLSRCAKLQHKRCKSEKKAMKQTC